jgi:hypothetical protein
MVNKGVENIVPKARSIDVSPETQTQERVEDAILGAPNALVKPLLTLTARRSANCHACRTDSAAVSTKGGQAAIGAAVRPAA